MGDEMNHDLLTTVIGTAPSFFGILFVIWQMNRLQDQIGRVQDQLNKRIDDVQAQLNKRIDNLRDMMLDHCSCGRSGDRYGSTK